MKSLTHFYGTQFIYHIRLIFIVSVIGKRPWFLLKRETIQADKITRNNLQQQFLSGFPSWFRPHSSSRSAIIQRQSIAQQSFRV